MSKSLYFTRIKIQFYNLLLEYLLDLRHTVDLWGKSYTTNYFFQESTAFLGKITTFLSYFSNFILAKLQLFPH